MVNQKITALGEHTLVKPKYMAGALQVTQATATIVNCSFYRNYATSDGGTIKGDISSNIIYY